MDLDPSRGGAVRAEGRVSGVHFQLYALALEGPVRWRLLSGNNRDLGRGPTPYLDMASCIMGLSAMRSVLSTLPSAKLSGELMAAARGGAAHADSPLWAPEPPIRIARRGQRGHNRVMAASSEWSPAQHYRLSNGPRTVVSASVPSSDAARQAETEQWLQERRQRRRDRLRACVWGGFVFCLLGVIAVCGALLLGGV